MQVEKLNNEKVTVGRREKSSLGQRLSNVSVCKCDFVTLWMSMCACVCVYMCVCVSHCCSLINQVSSDEVSDIK